MSRLQRPGLAGHAPAGHRGCAAADVGQTGSAPRRLPLATYFSGTNGRWILDNVEVPGHAPSRFSCPATWILGALESHPWSRLRAPRHPTSRTRAAHADGPRDPRLDDDLLSASAYRGPCCVHRALLRLLRRGQGHARRHPRSPAFGLPQAATFGQAAYDVGDARTRTARCFMLLNTGTELVQFEVGSSPRGWSWAITCGYCLEAHRHRGCPRPVAPRHPGLISTSQRSKARRDGRDNGGIYFVPAFRLSHRTGGDARGSIVGRPATSTRAHRPRHPEATAWQPARSRLQETDSGVTLKELKATAAWSTRGPYAVPGRLVAGPLFRPKVAEPPRWRRLPAGLAVGF